MYIGNVGRRALEANPKILKEISHMLYNEGFNPNNWYVYEILFDDEVYIVRNLANTVAVDFGIASDGSVMPLYDTVRDDGSVDQYKALSIRQAIELTEVPKGE